MANPIYIPITATGTYAAYVDHLQSPFNLTYAVEYAAGTTGTYTVSYTLDDPNDPAWTPIWVADPTNGTAQTATQGGFYSFPVRGVRVIFSALGGSNSARLAVLQGMSARQEAPIAASGTYNFNPSIGSIGAFAFGRCGIRRPQITVDHLVDMAMAANLVLVDFSLDEPNLWGVVLNSFPLVQGQAEYTLPSNVLMVLDCFIRITVGGVQNDRIIYGVSRSEYAAYPNKLMEAFPTVYWTDRLDTVTVSVYPAPDGNGPYTLFYYAVQQDQDAILAGGTQLSTPYRMISPFVDALAAKLALSYPPPPPITAEALDKVAERSYSMARRQENENVPLYITPGLSGYYS